MAEVGANRGFLVSKVGFQSGAIEAADFTNIDLLTWDQFESLFFDRWISGVTALLAPQFDKASALMDTTNDDFWKDIEFTEEAWNEWNSIIQQYPLVTIWSLFHHHSNVGMIPIPSFANKIILKSGNRNNSIVLDTYRKIVDFAPKVCANAIHDLSKFWQTQLRINLKKKSRRLTRHSPQKTTGFRIKRSTS